MKNKYFHLSFSKFRSGCQLGDETWRDSLELWVLHGIEPGSFLTSMLCNDLTGATNRTHPMNGWSTIIQFMKWLQHKAPPECWGSMDKVVAWITLSDEQRMDYCIAVGLMPSAWEILENKDKWDISGFEYLFF